MFIGRSNYKLDRPFSFQGTDKGVAVSFNVDTSHVATVETADVLLKYFRDNLNTDEMFPMQSFCAVYNDYVKAQSTSMRQAEKIALFEKIGDVVAKYNFYIKEQRLSSLNTTKYKKRIVYKKGKSKVWYLSLDLESGGFEAFDKNYIHLGQYNFSCERVKKPEPHRHKLIH